MTVSPEVIANRIHNEIAELNLKYEQILAKEPTLKTAEDMAMDLIILIEIDYQLQENVFWREDNGEVPLYSDDIIWLYTNLPMNINIVDEILTTWINYGLMNFEEPSEVFATICNDVVTNIKAGFYVTI